MKDLGPPWPPARSLRLGERDLLGIHCCLGSFSEERPMDTWPWKTGLGQGLGNSDCRSRNEKLVTSYE